MILLDTNVISELMKDHADPAVDNWYALNSNLIALPAPALGEIAYGVAKLPDGKRRDRLSLRLTEWRLRHMEKTLPFHSGTILIYGDLLANSMKNKHNMNPIDAQIAAIAVENDYALATRNIKDFKHTSVDLINPWNI